MTAYTKVFLWFLSLPFGAAAIGLATISVYSGWASADAAIQWVKDSFPWIIGFSGLIAGLIVSIQAKQELAKIMTPDISVLFDPHDERCMTPVQYQPSAPGLSAIFYPTSIQAGTLFRQACIVLENTSGAQIDNVEIYCEEISVVRASPEIYLLIPGGSFFAIHLCGGEPFRQGIIREIVETDDDGNATSKRIELTLPYKPQARNLRGSEFEVKVLIVGKTLHKPKRQAYRFGDRGGTLFFEKA